MSKHFKIKWTDNDTRELNRVVRNFNAKINRLAKNNPQIKNLLPEKVSARDLKELINTRQDLNRELNSLKRFSKRGSEEIVKIDNTDYNIKITKWQRTEMNRRVGVINRRRKARLQEIENIELTSGGNPLGYKVKDIGMGKATELALSPMSAWTRGMTQTSLKRKWKTIMQESQLDYMEIQDEQLRENIVKAILENYNPSDVTDVIQNIRDMSPEKLIKLYQQEGGNFEFFYPPDEEQYQAYLEHLKATWS